MNRLHYWRRRTTDAVVDGWYTLWDSLVLSFRILCAGAVLVLPLLGVVYIVAALLDGPCR